MGHPRGGGGVQGFQMTIALLRKERSIIDFKLNTVQVDLYLI